MSIDNPKCRKFIAIVWRSFWNQVTEDDAEKLGVSLYQFVFKRLPKFLAGGFLPREGLVDKTMLAALLNYTENSAGNYARRADAKTFRISQGDGFDLSSLTTNLVKPGDAKSE